MLFDQFGRPYEKRKAPERRALASAPILDAWREYVSTGLTPRRLGRIFREADAGNVRRQADLFEQIEERDGHLCGERSKRVNGILGLEFRISPASEDARDARAAEFCSDFIDGRSDWPDLLTSLQDAVGKGYAASEIGWDVSEGQALPDRFEFIEQTRFIFTGPDGILRRHPLLLTDADSMGLEIPPWKILLHRYGGKSGHPARSGLYRVIAWLYLAKNYSLKDWIRFAEVYGQPLRVGKYDSGASEADKEALFAAVRALGSDAAGVISRATEIEFVEAAAKGASAEVFERLASFANKEMSKALLGQTLSADVGDKGSYAAAKTHNDVRLDLLHADGRALAATIREQFIRPMVGFNFGWDTPTPGFDAIWEETEDLDAKSLWMDRLLARGVVMPLAWVRRSFGIPDPEGDEPVIGAVVPERAPTDPAEAKTARMVAGKATPAPTEADPEENLVGQLADRSAPLLDELLDPVRALVARAGSLEEIRGGILELFPEMEPADLGAMIHRAIAAAELAGRADAAAEDEE